MDKLLVAFKQRYGFTPKRELARVYWLAGIRLQANGDEAQSMIAFCHAMRLDAKVIQ